MEVGTPCPNWLFKDVQRVIKGVRHVSDIVLHWPVVVCIGAGPGARSRHILDFAADSYISPRLLLYEPVPQMASMLQKNLGRVYKPVNQWREIVESDRSETPLPAKPNKWNPVMHKKNAVATIVPAAVVPRTLAELAAVSEDALADVLSLSGNDLPFSLGEKSTCTVRFPQSALCLATRHQSRVPEGVPFTDVSVPVAPVDCVPACDVLDIDCCGDEENILGKYLGQFKDGSRSGELPKIVSIRAYGSKSLLKCLLVAEKHEYVLLDAVGNREVGQNGWFDLRMIHQKHMSEASFHCDPLSLSKKTLVEGNFDFLLGTPS